MQIVLDSRDSTDDPVALLCKKELDSRVLMEWVLVRIDQLVYVATQRRDPVGVSAI